MEHHILKILHFAKSRTTRRWLDSCLVMVGLLWCAACVDGNSRSNAQPENGGGYTDEFQGLLDDGELPFGGMEKTDLTDAESLRHDAKNKKELIQVGVELLQNHLVNPDSYPESDGRPSIAYINVTHNPIDKQEPKKKESKNANQDAVEDEPTQLECEYDMEKCITLSLWSRMVDNPKRIFPVNLRKNIPAELALRVNFTGATDPDESSSEFPMSGVGEKNGVPVVFFQSPNVNSAKSLIARIGKKIRRKKLHSAKSALNIEDSNVHIQSARLLFFEKDKEKNEEEEKEEKGRKTIGSILINNGLVGDLDLEYLKALKKDRSKVKE